MASNVPFRSFAHSRDRRTSARALLFSPPATPFSAISTTIRSRDPYLMLVTFTALLSEFMPVLLCNVVFGLTRTKETQMICIWLATAILAWMIVVVVVSCLCIRWIDVPVAPNSIAGVLYYVTDSKATSLLRGPNLPSDEELRQRVEILVRELPREDIVRVPVKS